MLVFSLTLLMFPLALMFLVGIHLSSVRCSTGSGVHGEGEEDPEGLLPASQPALLSLGADGVIRVWVEVTLAPVLGTDARAGNGLTLPASHYCCTLVIQVRLLRPGTQQPTFYGNCKKNVITIITH
jgi:hypothetical protein